jgi:hypothetical protein
MNSLQDELNGLVREFSSRIAAAVERFTSQRIDGAVAARGGKRKGRAAGAAPRRARRGATRCYYPGCKNTAAPRFGMFCAAKHKNLSKTEKERYRKQHLAARS